MPQAPPTEVAAMFVDKGKVRAVPFTDVSVTTGAVVSMMTDCAPLVPTLAKLSVWVAVTLYVPAADSAGANV